MPETAASPEVTRTAPRWHAWISPAIGVLLFGASLWVLHRELRQIRYRELVAAFGELPPAAVVLSLLFMTANYLVLTGFDLLAFRYIGKWVAPWRIMAASFVGYSISNNVGFALLSGTSVRYRFYSRWGLTPGDLSRVVVFYSGTFYVGLLLLGGWSLAFHPHPALGTGPRELAVRALGGLLLLLAAGYAVAPLFHRAPIRIFRFEIPIPPARLVLGQFLLSTADWILAAAILYPLLPPSGPSFGEVLGAFLAAQLLGLISHVPGGIGVFEGMMVLQLGARIPTQTLLSSLILFRIVYYLIPLALALLVLLGDEVRQRRHQVRRWGTAFGGMAYEVAPKVLAAFIFVAGAVLLFSGATPAAPDRLAWVLERLPLPVLEAAHFLSSVTGVGLLIAAHGIARRLGAAYRATAGLLGVGVALALLKGGSYEEAFIMGTLLAILIAAREHFDRRTAFWRTRFSAGWALAAVLVVAASVRLGLFAFRPLELSIELWWQFHAGDDEARFLRASAGSTLSLLAFGIVRLLRPAPPAFELPTNEELEAASAVLARQSSMLAFRVFQRDKALLWNEARNGFLMYAVQGRSWVALGDPVTEGDGSTRLIREFIERADDYGARPVFYQVSKERLPEYADLGLTLIELGEEARVPLAEFAGPGDPFQQAGLLLTERHRDGDSFRVVPPAGVAAMAEELREVSVEWLRERRRAEMGFSFGHFDAEHVQRFPVAVLEREGQMVAFASLWPQGRQQEIAVDLLRFRGSASACSAEALLHHLALWGRQQGYRFINLGMVPPLGVANSPAVSLWERLGWGGANGLGESLLGLERLRALRERFHREWELRYLAYPGGLPLPRVLADVSALITRGPRRTLPTVALAPSR